jgi:hypothetical protein
MPCQPPQVLGEWEQIQSDINQRGGEETMNEHSKRNAVLASVGLLALGIYILACSSPAFSPDDRKVLYPAFDASSGGIGMAVYDREKRSSELWFQPVAYENGGSNAVAGSCIIRAQWLPNGRDIVVAYIAPGDNRNKGALNVAVVPWGTRGPIKVFRVPDIEDPVASFVMPLCLANERLFFLNCRSGAEVVRLDLRTGALTPHKFPEANENIQLYPAPDGESIFCLQEDKGPDKKVFFSRLNPEDFSRKPLMPLPSDLPDNGAIAYDKTGSTFVMLGNGDKTNTVVVLREGRPIFTRSLDIRGQERAFINAILANNGKAVRASFAQADGTNGMAYGLMEIPFSEAPTREVILIKGAPKATQGSAYYFQFAVSHDGKTAAVASTYLACTDKSFNPADCALFFVDLSNPKWKVTKVPIPMPANRPDFSH